MSDLTLRLLLLFLLVTNTVGAISGVLVTRSLGALLTDYRRDQKEMATLRTEFLSAERRQTDAMAQQATESRRLSALICTHLTSVGKLHKPCPAP